MARGAEPFVHRRVVRLVANYHQGDVSNGLCHGVRCGAELELFRKFFYGGNWIGTELTEELCNEVDVFNKDFHELVPEWVGKFDVVYTNSLDHSHSPEFAIARWLGQLSAGGLLYIEWTRYHNHCGKGGGNRADCFSATKNEYEDLMRRCGQLVDVLHVMRRRRFVFVVAPAGDSDARLS